MEKLVDYRRHAEECRQLSARAQRPSERQMLLDMAESWEELAQTRERVLAARATPDAS